MNTEETHMDEQCYSVRRRQVSQGDLWTLRDGTPFLVLSGDTEALYVIGSPARNNADSSEQFTPCRADGKISAAYRHEGHAQWVCRNLNVPAAHTLWRVVEGLSNGSAIRCAHLTDVALHYFLPGLAYARWQEMREGYDRAFEALV